MGVQVITGNYVLPILAPTMTPPGRPSLAADRKVFTYPQGISRVTEDAAPHISGRSFSVAVNFEVKGSPPHGVLVAQGGRFGGWSLYFNQGTLTFHYNAIDPRQYQVVSDRPIGAGRHSIEMVFQADSAWRGAGGTISFVIDGKAAGKGQVPLTLPGWISHIEGLDVGRDTGTAVSADYVAATSAFNGHFPNLTVTLLD